MTPADLGARYATTVSGKPLIPRLNVSNLTSKRYWLNSHYVGAPRSVAFSAEDVGTKAWTAALKRAGIEDFRWHDLRHTFATWHRRAGTPTHELQRLGGWKSGAMVERYAHVAPEALQDAAARLDAMTGYETATPDGPTA